MEPFPTSVFKGLTGIFATTTKICTSQLLHGRLRSPLQYNESAPPTHEPKFEENLTVFAAKSRSIAWAPSIFRAVFIRQVSCYTDSLAVDDFHDHRPAV